jgi:holliday junction DNA helicase RuvA
VDQKLFTFANNTVREEALSALVMLGFPRAAAQKVVEKIMEGQPDCKVEVLVKQALKIL